MLKPNIARIHPRNLGRYCQPMGAIRSIRFAAAIVVCLSVVLVPPANAQTKPHAQTKPPEVIFLNGKDFREGKLVVPETKEGAADTKRWVVVDLSAGRPLKKVDYGGRLLPWVGSDKVIALAFSGRHALLPVEGADEAAKRLVERFEWIKQRYNVHDRMFLSGHSAGAQFAHRFAFRHPELVVGVWANAAGSWSGVEGWGEINDQARNIPFLLSCGELDTGKAFGGEAPYGRLDWMKHFAEDLKKRGFVVRTQIWPHKAHKGPSFEDNGPLIRECFLLATEGVKPESEGWSGDIERIAKQARRVSEAANEAHRQSAPIASHAAESKSILFIGNSFTRANNLPAIVSELTEKNGVSARIQMVTRNGYTIARHAKDEKTLAALGSRPWDYVVLQGHSLEPIFGKDQMIAGGKELAAKAGKARVYLYVTWAYETESRFKSKARNHMNGKTGVEDSKKLYSNMQKLLNEGYGELAKAINAELVPVGPAWELARKQHSDWKLYSRDQYHPSKTGSYLTALVFYKTLFGNVPKKSASQMGNQATHDKMIVIINGMPPMAAKKGARE